MNGNVKKITAIAMLVAMSYLLMLLSKLVPTVSGFLQYDAKDVSIVISGFIFGPLTALVITLVTALLELLTASHTGVIGLLMNIAATAAFCVTASFIYTKNRKLSGAVIGLIVGTIVLTAVMLLWNYFITPVYMKMPRKVVASMLPTLFLPFNLIKGGLNTAFALLLYRPIIGSLRASGLVPHGNNTKTTKKFQWTFILGIILLVVCIPLLFMLAGII